MFYIAVSVDYPQFPSREHLLFSEIYLHWYVLLHKTHASNFSCAIKRISDA
jgi:hypothetical protein